MKHIGMAVLVTALALTSTQSALASSLDRSEAAVVVQQRTNPPEVPVPTLPAPVFTVPAPVPGVPALPTLPTPRVSEVERIAVPPGTIDPAPDSRGGGDVRTANPGEIQPAPESRDQNTVESTSTDNSDDTNSGGERLCNNPRKEKKVNRGEGYCEDGVFVQYKPERSANTRGDDPPSVVIDLSTAALVAGNTAVITVKMHDADGIKRIWWWVASEDQGQLSSSTEAGSQYAQSCDGAKDCNRQWQFKVTSAGPLTFYAQGEDSAGRESNVVAVSVRVSP
ncbi:MAG: hypothetical protein U0821_20005 [Chloroflexota bacterium]